MRQWAHGILVASAAIVALSGCGSVGSAAASRPEPPAPLVISAYIGSGGVRVSPARLGAGPVLLTVANRSARAVMLTLTRAGHELARTAPINPGGVTQVKVALDSGTYTVAALGTAARSDAARSHASTHALTTTVMVGAERASSGSQVLQP